MLNIAKQTIDFYMKNLKTPNINELNVENANLLNERSSSFVTIYYKWNIRGSSWNIKEIKENTASEIIENTIWLEPGLSVGLLWQNQCPAIRPKPRY